MKIDIQTPGFKARQELLDLINQKVGRLSHLSDRIVEIRVLIKASKSGTRDNKVCEISGVMPGKDLFVERKALTFEKAIVEATDVMKQQITEWKEKKEQR